MCSWAVSRNASSGSPPAQCWWYVSPPTRQRKRTRVRGAPHVSHGTLPQSSAPTLAPTVLFEHWHSSERSLTRAEAQRRLLEVGANEPTQWRRGAVHLP